MGTIHDEIAPNKSGRIYLDEFATEHDVPLHKFRNMNDDDALLAFRAADLDWLYVIGWSQMAKSEVLSIPRAGWWASIRLLLPQGRGRASIPWAIIKGLDETGVTMFKLDEGVDTGPILGQAKVPISADETSTTLYEKVVDAHRQLIRLTYPHIADGTIELVEQDHSQATEWPGRKPSDGLIEPLGMSSLEVDRMVRALTRPYPGAFMKQPDGALLRVWAGHAGPGDGLRVATADGVYTVTDHSIDPPA